MFYFSAMTIKIKDTVYQFKQTIRALFLWEQIAQRPFEIKTLLDNYLYFYCILLANNPDFMLWDEFIDALDDDPEIFQSLVKILNERNAISDLINPEDESDKDKKKE